MCVWYLQIDLFIYHFSISIPSKIRLVLASVSEGTLRRWTLPGPKVRFSDTGLREEPVLRGFVRAVQRQMRAAGRPGPLPAPVAHPRYAGRQLHHPRHRLPVAYQLPQQVRRSPAANMSARLQTECQRKMCSYCCINYNLT